MTRDLCLQILILLGSTTASLAKSQDILIYANDSFISEWGPGPALQKKFELQCKCRIKWVSAADGASLLARLKIEGTKTKADIVIGIDDALTSAAESLSIFAETGLNRSKILSKSVKNIPQSTKFVPYDYGYYAFMFDKKSKKKNGQPFSKPKSLGDLLNSPELRQTVLIQDPRTSATGMGLILWLQAIYGNELPKSLRSLRNQTLKVSKGWSESYSLFTKGEAPLVLSYTTSEAYHREIEKEDRYEALIFPEGHYVARENAAILSTSKNINLAKAFLEFLLTEESQMIIAQKNWMYPVLDLTSKLPDSFKMIGRPTSIIQTPAKTIESNRKAWIGEWEKSFLK